MQDFFTWAMLATYAGAVLATTLITQLLKGVGFIDRMPTRIFSYIVALAVLLVATFFTGGCGAVCHQCRCGGSGGERGV